MIPAYAPYQTAAPPELSSVGSSPDSDRHPSRSDRAVAAALAITDTRRFSLRPVWGGRILLTLNQLAVMNQNGIEIADALELVARSCRDKRLAHSLREIHDAVSSGHSLSYAVGTHGIYFPTTLAPMLAAAEASGDVADTLGRVCTRMRGELKMRGTIIGAMIYPAILVVASSVVMSALILGVLPQFSRVFESMGRPIPIYTQLLLSFGQLCRDWWPAIAVILVGVTGALLAFRRHAIIRRTLGHVLMYGPLIRDAYRPLQAGRVLRTIASMVQGGVPLLQAVQLSGRTTSDEHWCHLLQRIEEKLIEGSTASSAFADVDFVPPETAQLIATAERTGRVSEVLEDIGTFYEEEAQRRIKRLVVALEPAIIIVMGVIVAGVVMSVMLPLLDVSTIGS